MVRRSLRSARAPRPALPGRVLGVLAAAVLLSAGLAPAAQAAPVGLGTAGEFAVLGGSSVTNTGPTVLTGDLGLYPGTSITGFPPGTVSGATHANDAVAQQAQTDLTTAYDDAAGRSSTATIGDDLAGRTLTPGVYSSASSMGLSGDLTLDAQGDPAAVFVFQAGSTLETGSGSRVLLQGGAQACNVFWQVGSSATIGTSSQFVGTILALTSISMTTGATLQGRALARNGAVTLDTNTVTRSTCATGAADGGDTSGGGQDGGGDGGGGLGTGGPTTSPVTTGSALDAPGDSVRLTGTVLSGAVTTAYFFQYGRTRRYGRRTATTDIGGGARSMRIRRRVRGLRPGRRYHYRIVGVRSDGSRVYGRDRTFRIRPTALPPIRRGGFTG